MCRWAPAGMRTISGWRSRGIGNRPSAATRRPQGDRVPARPSVLGDVRRCGRRKRGSRPDRRGGFGGPSRPRPRTLDPDYHCPGRPGRGEPRSAAGRGRRPAKRRMACEPWRRTVQHRIRRHGPRRPGGVLCPLPRTGATDGGAGTFAGALRGSLRWAGALPGALRWKGGTARSRYWSGPRPLRAWRPQHPHLDREQRRRGRRLLLCATRKRYERTAAHGLATAGVLGPLTRRRGLVSLDQIGAKDGAHDIVVKARVTEGLAVDEHENLTVLDANLNLVARVPGL